MPRTVSDVAARIDSLSNHQVSPGQLVYAHGSGFVDVVGVQVGDAWADNLHVDGEGLASFDVPQQPDGTPAWVVVHLADGTTSPCEGDAQMLEYRSPVLEAPPGEMLLTALIPETVTLGRADTYWLTGSGLSMTAGVIIGNDAAAYETHDDTRLMLHIPAIEGPEDGMIELSIFGGGHSASLQVPCTSGAVAPSHDYHGPEVISVEPASLPAAGGEITIHGSDLDRVTLVCVGPTVTAQPYWVTADRIIATVPSLADAVGQELGVEVADGDMSSGTGHLHTITVTS